METDCPDCVYVCVCVLFSTEGWRAGRKPTYAYTCVCARTCVGVGTFRLQRGRNPKMRGTGEAGGTDIHCVHAFVHEYTVTNHPASSADGATCPPYTYKEARTLHFIRTLCCDNSQSVAFQSLPPPPPPPPPPVA